MNKKIIIASISGLSLFGVAQTAGATSTVFTMPSIGDLLGYAIDAASPFFTALWPIIGLLLGIGFVGFLVGKITHLF